MADRQVIIDVLNAIPEGSLKTIVIQVKSFLDSLNVRPATGSMVSAPGHTNYNAQEPIKLITPSGGWISDSEVQRYSQAIGEAIKTESWVAGFMQCVQLILMAH